MDLKVGIQEIKKKAELQVCSWNSLLGCAQGWIERRCAVALLSRSGRHPSQTVLVGPVGDAAAVWSVRESFDSPTGS